MNDSSPNRSEDYARTMAKIMTLERRIKKEFFGRPYRSFTEEEYKSLRTCRRQLTRLARTLWIQGQNLKWDERDGRELVLQDVSEPPTVGGADIQEVLIRIKQIDALRRAINRWLQRVTNTHVSFCWFKDTSTANGHQSFLHKRLRTLLLRREALEQYQHRLNRAPVNNDAWTEDLPESATDQHLAEACKAFVRHVRTTYPELEGELAHLDTVLTQRVHVKKPLSDFEQENAYALTPGSPQVQGHYHAWRKQVSKLDPLEILRTHTVVPGYTEHTPIGRWCAGCGYTGIRSTQTDLCEQCEAKGVDLNLVKRLYHSPKPTVSRSRWIEFLGKVCAQPVTIGERVFRLVPQYGTVLPLLPPTLHWWNSDQRLIRLSHDRTEAGAHHAIVLTSRNRDRCMEEHAFLEAHLPLR